VQKKLSKMESLQKLYRTPLLCGRNKSLSAGRVLSGFTPLYKTEKMNVIITSVFEAELRVVDCALSGLVGVTGNISSGVARRC
jgi:hypothetical protein